MEQDRYAIQLERALFNYWKQAKEENADPTPMFNALRIGMDAGMQVLVPSEVKPFDKTKNADKAIQVNFCRLPASDPNEFFLPVFTSKEQYEKGKEAPALVPRPLIELVNFTNRWPNCAGIIINPWDLKMPLTPDTMRIVTRNPIHSIMIPVRASVLDLHVDAIVNAANNSLLGGGGVDGAIHEAAGPELLEECRSLKGCDTGRSKVTKAYNITTSDYIIHTVGPVFHNQEQDADLLASCYRTSLDLALSHNCETVAFPCISTGAYNFPLKPAAQVAMVTVYKWFLAHPQAHISVYFCCFTDEEMASYVEVFKEWAEKSKENKNDIS